MITVVGLGNNKGDITLRAAEAIKGADYVIVKTALIKSYEYFVDNDINTISLDNIYIDAEDFDQLQQMLCDKVLSYQEFNTVYCVEGSGVDDLSVIELSKIAKINIIAGVSNESTALSFSPYNKHISIFASEFTNMRAFYPDTNCALVIKELDNCFLASDVKLKLLNLIGDEKAIYLYDDEAYHITISELDRQAEYDNTSTLLIPPLGNLNKQRYNFSDLMEITYRLRDPNGCKWDRAQTHQSIRANAIEEAYELVEAIDLEDIDKMLEETGDVLLQGIFHAVIAESGNNYDINDVMSVLCHKLISRHTHIFGDDKAENSEEALKAWESAKAKEKGHNSYSDKLDSIADNLPALIRAYKVQKTAKKSGFDWNDINGAVKKVNEELEELLTADKEHQEGEGGDLIFAAVNVLRFLDINPELALNKTIAKFLKRFRYMESHIESNGKSLEQSTLEEMDRYWEESKNEDR